MSAKRISRRQTLATISAAMAPTAATAFRLPDLPKEDPIFAAIANWKEAAAEHSAAWERVDAMETPPEYKWRSHFEGAETDKATNREFDAFAQLLWTMPTTLAGFAALFEFLGSPLPYYESEQAPYSGMDGAIEAFTDVYERDLGPPNATQWAAMIAEGLRRL